ncbi:50S ribosomal protein L9 [Sulfurimonas sp. MAG313]|nr:50S ribosomal protein L9 [Sulfurimonas sp. MAG313]MDF1881580.1 50S ribosomal protein L9 [Sulfurimonas sp. MAG313]
MKVLLIKDVKGLGKTGEIKDVKDGYGQNFLIGKGFARAATNAVINQHNSSEKKKAENEALELTRLKEVKEQLTKLTTTISKKVGDNGHLFGSVTKDEIAHCVQEQHNIVIDKKHIVHKLSMKEVGEYEIDLKLGHGLHAMMKINITAQ